MTASDTEAVIRAYLAACNADDLGRVLELLDGDVELHEADALPGAVHAVGFDSVKRYLERFMTHWQAFHWQPLELESAGDRGLMLGKLSLEGRESGVAVEREWWYVFRVRAGKILRQDGFDDRAAAERAYRA